ncbi:MAG: amino acid permease [Muribaculaceae bacterium]|nr:amino acid permease [Muribaculaceae bacterium]
MSNGKLGFWGLTALVFGLVVGLGIFNLPQNMAASASPGAVFWGWVITGLGILPLVLAFKWLSTHYPQYNAGLYQYALAGFGKYAGFNIAWGYWLCSAFSNVAYAVILNDSVGAFFPVLLKHGAAMVIFGSIMIWVMFFIVSMGLRTAKFINNLLALIKILMLLGIISVFIIFFRLDLFKAEIWGDFSLIGTPMDQIKSTMMITLFCFFGVEGAVMMSARAKKYKDVGKAGIAGFLISLTLYLLVSLLCYGLMARAQLAKLPNPSIAYILRDVCGSWAYWTVIVAIIISLLGGWVSWTLVVAQVPYEAALVKILPPVFKKTNRHGMPTFGLMASSVVMMLFLLLVVMADDVYLAALHITSLMIIPCYLFTGLFLYKVAPDLKIKGLATVTILFCLWMAYAGGLKLLFMTSLFYLLGTGFYIRAQRDNYPERKKLFTPVEWVFFILLCVASAVTVYLLTLY